MLVLSLLAQFTMWGVSPARPTVGDTVLLVRRIAEGPDLRVRLAPLERSALLEPLAAPRWAYAEGEFVVSYPVALFAPGDHVIPMPDIEFVSPAGASIVVAGDAAFVTVSSVLPAGDSLPSPLPSQGPIARSRRTLVPAALLAAVAVGLAAAWGALRSRRRSRPAPPLPVEEVLRPAIDQWVAAGESRAVAAVVADRLRSLIAVTVPAAGRDLHTEECIARLLEGGLGPLARDLAGVLRALDRARFSPAAPGDVLEVVDDAERAMTSLQAAGSVET